jgi:hypothetical protein
MTIQPSAECSKASSASTLNPPYPRLFVFNADPSHKPGKLWVAINVDSLGRGEFSIRLDRNFFAHSRTT